MHEVVVDNGRGHHSVRRVTANSAKEAREFVQAELDAALPPVPHIVSVAGPSELAERERQAQAEVARRQRAGR